MNTTTMENSMEAPQKLKIELPYDLAVSPRRIPKEMINIF
jgi:hypothetical protein